MAKASLSPALNFLRLEEKIGDLRKPAARGRVRIFEDYVPFTFEDVADGAHLRVFHARIISWLRYGVIGYPLRALRVRSCSVAVWIR